MSWCPLLPVPRSHLIIQVIASHDQYLNFAGTGAAAMWPRKAFREPPANGTSVNSSITKCSALGSINTENLVSMLSTSEAN